MKEHDLRPDYDKESITMFSFRLDPTGHYSSVDERTLIRVTGRVGGWIANAPQDETLLDTIDREYVWGFNDLTGATVDPDTGIMYYLGDPPQYPVMVWEKDSQRMFSYEHDFVAFVDLESNEVIRVGRID